MLQKTLVLATAVAAVFLLAGSSNVEAFTSSSLPIAKKAILHRPLAVTVTLTMATTTTEEAAAATTTADDYAAIYDQLGIETVNLALGIQPDEVLKYIGTYVHRIRG